MSLKRSIAITSILIIVGFSTLVLGFVPNIERVVTEEIILGAHRGNSLDYTENTLEAFQSALDEDRYRFIEFDIQYTKDKVLVVHHDTSLIRLQQKHQVIEDLTYEELLNASDYHIPKYVEVMDLIDGEKPVNIEIKSQGDLLEDKEIVDFVIRDCIERGVLGGVLISSISSEVIIYVKEEYPESKTGKVYYVAESTFLNFDAFTSSLYGEMNKTQADYLMLHGSNLRNYDSLRRLLPEDKTLVIWYFNDEMYVVQPKEDSWVFKFRSFKETLGAQGDLISGRTSAKPSEEACVWWC